MAEENNSQEKTLDPTQKRLDKAKEDGEKEFEVDGKTYKVTEDWSKVTLAEKLDRILGNKRVL